MALVVAPLSGLATEASFAADNETKQPTTKVTASARGKKVAPAKLGQAKRVEMFDAMEQGLITVDYIGRDSKEANIIFKNKSDESLDVVLPETFGALPVVAQMMGGMGGMGMGGMGGGGMGGMGGGMGGMGGGMGGMGGGQGMGGGFGGMGGMGGGMGGMGGMGGGMGGMGGMGMGGMMRVEPDRPRKVTVPTLCLEHGKADPNPRMKYRIVRLSEVNANPEVAELCKALAQGKVPQNTAQAAAWHIANGLSWEELAKKPRVISEYTGIELYFSGLEIQNALRLTALVQQSASESNTSSASQTPNSGKSAQYNSPGENE
jgi:hypothetical protein